MDKDVEMNDCPILLTSTIVLTAQCFLSHIYSVASRGQGPAHSDDLMRLHGLHTVCHKFVAMGTGGRYDASSLWDLLQLEAKRPHSRHSPQCPPQAVDVSLLPSLSPHLSALPLTISLLTFSTMPSSPLCITFLTMLPARSATLKAEATRRITKAGLPAIAVTQEHNTV
ncbi:hypothetical protein JZ751_004905 [Albula glossodonta]|uniref:Uncharacterized protein n=1 Tax=Albula glossodonta TaxID=121402 RepID=A0A8T2PCV6_9TELE|nr:hypothetical protein JZ751_004905 [Albula glossodonta]